nr:response regulator transcription factor [candidate division Zixibacteria bacterium]
MRTRILLADDHKLFTDGLRSLLAERADFEVIGEAGDGLTAVDLAREKKPHIILMDISMGGLNGIEATRRILADHPKIRIVMLSMHSDRRYVVESFRAGAAGYLLKDSALDELITALQTVLRNDYYLSSGITNIVIRDYIKLTDDEQTTAFSLLSSREREVLQLVAEGKSTKEIAAFLNLSVKTIETHRKQIMEKLNIHSVAELTKYAIREGLTRLE